MNSVRSRRMPRGIRGRRRIGGWIFTFVRPRFRKGSRFRLPGRLRLRSRRLRRSLRFGGRRRLGLRHRLPRRHRLNPAFPSRKVKKGTPQKRSTAADTRVGRFFLVYGGFAGQTIAIMREGISVTLTGSDLWWRFWSGGVRSRSNPRLLKFKAFSLRL